MIWIVVYFRILTICLLLVYFVSAARCHCFDLDLFALIRKKPLSGNILIRDILSSVKEITKINLHIHKSEAKI